MQVRNTVLPKAFMRSPLVLIGKKSTNVKRGGSEGRVKIFRPGIQRPEGEGLRSPFVD